MFEPKHKKCGAHVMKKLSYGKHETKQVGNQLDLCSNLALKATLTPIWFISICHRSTLRKFVTFVNSKVNSKVMHLKQTKKKKKFGVQRFA